MKIVKLEAENFKVLRTVEITPEGNVVTIGGKNGQGKSSVLDAVWVALAGRSAAPPKPIRTGEEECRIRLDLGELIITRKFTDKDGKITDSVKVESADGKQRFNSPQAMLNELLGEIGFDPFEFVQMKPEAQADRLIQMVPLPIDLEAMARMDAADYEKRRDVNREGQTLRGQLDGMPVIPDLPETPIDREAILAKLASAADTNTAIEREIRSREERAETIVTRKSDAESKRTEAEQLRARAAALDEEATMLDRGTADREAELAALPPIDEPIDTGKLREELSAAEETNRQIERMAERAHIGTRLEALRKESAGFTAAMEAREKARQEALSKAKMPIAGLAFAVNEKGTPVVMFNGVPFEQASTAEQLRASTAIAMAANPELRVLRIKDGALLDEDSMNLLADMAAEEDFQLWVEVVGNGGVGIVMENGTVKGAAPREPEPDKPKAKKPAAVGGKEGPLL